MSPMPRRLPPSKEERDATVRRRMLPGAHAGGSRQVAPVRRRGETAAAAAGGPTVYFQDEEPVGAKVGDLWVDTDGDC